jgi:acetyl-CoA carboxylase biotin carboxylase subunit
MFRKVLIANRGEIALRIIRTCKKLKVRTVAVYSDADLESRHIVEANEAYNIGQAEPSASYLNIGKIVKVARKSRAEAVHPGYGFLAENPDLARACEESGLVFVGPRSRVLGQVANKLESKKFAAQAGVPVIPGATSETGSPEKAEEVARKIGLPIVIKAVFGGGGRGMRVVRNMKDLRRALEIARVEAESGFGRPELYMEKYLEESRHIEVQILSGPRGRTIHLGERECSLQRRYQKILEETPSPALDSKQRKRLLSLALKVAAATHYENAGTVEFVMSRAQDFYYLETNKRIQVEHLITEMVTGVDIVEQQLRMASERELSLSQNEITFSGAAINCRINAEDPARGFAPSPGTVTHFTPPGGPGIRVDTALYDGAPVPEYYDSLIAKVASIGSGRTEATQRMKVALEEMSVEGVKTTIPLHLTILEEKRFVEGTYHTQLLDTLLPEWSARAEATPDEIAGIYAAVEHEKRSAHAQTVSATVRATGWKYGLREESRPKPALYVEAL